MKLWSELITTGINAIPEKPEKRRHVLTNQYALSSVICAAAWCFCMLIFQKSTLLLPAIAAICYGVGCYILNINGYRNSSRYLLLTGSSLLVFYLSNTYGAESGAHLLLFPVMSFPLLLFHPSSYYLMLENAAISLLLLLTLNEAASSTLFIYDDNTVTSSYILFFIASITITVANLLRFLRLQSQSAKTSDKTNSSLLSIIEQSPDGILLLDENWCISQFNNAFHNWHQKATGITLQKRDDVHKTLKSLEITSPGVTGRWITHLKKAFSGMQFTIVETCTYSNQELTLDIHFNPVIENKKLTGVCIYFRNITEQVLHQQMLEQNLAENKELALIAVKTDKPIVITDCNFRIEWVNESFTELCGFNKEECTGRRIQELTGETHFESNNASSLIQQLEKGEAVTVETICTDRNKQKKWISSNITPIYNALQQCEKFIIVKSDITEYKTHEAELRNRYHDSRKMALVAQNSDISVMITDKNNSIEWVNEGFIKFFGFEESLCLGKKTSEVLHGSMTTPQMLEKYAEKLQSGRHFTHEIILYNNKGENNWVSLNVTPFFNDKDEIEKYICIIADISSQKQQEEQIRKLLIQDKDRIWELQSQNTKLSDKTKELETAREALHIKAAQLEQSNRFKSEFLANMSHELRTPLNSIIILSRLLFENKENTLNKRQLDFARIVNKSGDDLLSLINDILDLSKIEAGKIELEITAVETEEIAQDMIALFNEVAREKKINFAVTTEPGLPESFLTDVARTGQILKNLLSNAFKFTPEEGSVCLNISCNNNNIHFKVIDTGAGIAADKLHLIFEAFRQEDGSVNRKYGGTGLGLSISKELTVMLNGTITVESVIGKGSTFTLTLPLTSNESTVVAKHQYTALIVEDNENENHMIKHVMAKQGYNCLAAFGINDAMTLITENKVHVLILDLNLPDGCGIEILKHVKETPHLTDISIIIYTSRDLVPAETSLLESYSNIIIKKENKSILTLQEETVRFLRKIPLKKPEHNLGQANHKPETIHLKGKNVLIVDDDERNIYAISNTLEGQDMHIFKATTGMEAIRQLQINPEIDLVLMDVMMPDMDGIETTKQIRLDLAQRKLPIIAVTAKAMKQDRELCLTAGMDEYITKPVDTNRLLSVMNSFFE